MAILYDNMEFDMKWQLLDSKLATSSFNNACHIIFRRPIRNRTLIINSKSQLKIGYHVIILD